ncbi:hypothetical protein [Actinomycetospora aeridis]|uniref:Uncharacterized protein n=1 Tax=Actinomycetospora aeridis TaxID=3129231 RepID=A0ABU8MZN7_9PSEU
MADRYRRPREDDRPDPVTAAERVEFDALSETSLDSVTASAERWRNGLAGLTTVVTGALLIKGPANAADVPVGWRIALTILFGVGIAVSVSGLWLALRAAAGVPARIRFDDLRRNYGTVRLYKLALAERAATDLGRARAAALVASLLLAAAALTWWWAPPDPTAARSVTVTHGTARSCGVVVESDAAGLRLAVRNTPTHLTIPWTTVTSVRPGPCP